MPILSPSKAAPAGTLQTPVPENPLRIKALRALDDLPPFSPIMNRLLASLAGEDVSFVKLGELIEKDTVIAGNLLQVVNSALYARRTAINSVRHAVSVLGVAKLRNVVLGMSVANLWNRTRVPASWSMKRFDMHSAAVAILGDLLAQHVPVSYPEGAFVTGLFHDLGRLLIAIGLPKENALIAEHFRNAAGSGQPVSLIQCEEAVLGFSHASLSADALAVWKLPGLIQAAVAAHHDPWPDALPSGTEIPLGRLIDAANQYVNSTGNSIAFESDLAASDSSRINSLGLSPERLEQLLAEFLDEYAAMLKFFV